MVGKKSVNWTVANKAKALEGLLSFNAVRVEKDVCDQIAIYIGNGCTGKAVDSLFTQIGKRYKPDVLKAVAQSGLQVAEADGLTIHGKQPNIIPATKGPKPGTISGRVSKPTKATPAKVQKANAGPLGQLVADLQAYAAPHSPPTSGEEYVKSESSTIRSGPRDKKAKVDYKALSGANDGENPPDTDSDRVPSDNFDINEHMANSGDGVDDPFEV
ncbi:hypothetical protein MMC10_008317 [Thelotrema lepadinum]|nr:hypothetical protein [Thelotrema lepadinum]